MSWAARTHAASIVSPKKTACGYYIARGLRDPLPVTIIRSEITCGKCKRLLGL